MTKEDFDIQVGMNVYSADGEKIGTISQVAGFGATRVHEVSDHQADGLATEAGSSTGFLKVDRTSVSGPGAAELLVPFSRIRDLKADFGVTLIDAAIAQTGLPQAQAPHVEEAKGHWWQRQRKGRKSTP